MTKETHEWLEKVAKKNGVTKEEVLRYIKSLSSKKKVIHHLKLT